MRDRVILHSDINCCYAQIECQQHPELRGLPVVVGGNEADRHGIVLARNLHAKRYGIATAETLASARRKCPGLVVVPPDYRLYLDVSRHARKLYYDYSDMVEPFGPDEAWIRIDGSLDALGMTPRQVAEEISERMKAELGISVSIGISWNKIFAKFGSDYRKPDAITEITRQNYRDIVWPASVRDLLYVGPATQAKLYASGIETIGQLACASDGLLRRRLGAMGPILQAFAHGSDDADVKALDPTRTDVNRTVKSYGNGITFHRDITDPQTAKAVIWMLAESVAQRMREGCARARTVSIGIRRADLSGYSRQAPCPQATNITNDIAQTAWGLLQANEALDDSHPIRALHVQATNLVPAPPYIQEQIFEAVRGTNRREALDRTVDSLRRRYGNTCIMWGPKACDAATAGTDAIERGQVHPVSFFHR